ncbi:Uncharacterized protein OBRU01_16022, partial [Operophtera brumata]
IGESVVREGAWGGAGSRAYRRTPRTADWSDAETVRFYRALAAMGTDFTLMQPLFPNRNRRDLKLKIFGQSTGIPSTMDEYVKFQEERKRKSAEKRPRKKKEIAEFVPASATPMKGVVPTASPAPTSSPSLATLTLLDRHTKLKQIAPKKPMTRHDMATIMKEVPLPLMPPNIEKGSLVVLTVNDPQSPSRKMLQTYIAQGPGNLTPVSLPANFLNSVVGFMKRSNSPIPTTVVGSPVTLERSKTPNIISPRKRKSSYTITQL